MGASPTHEGMAWSKAVEADAWVQRSGDDGASPHDDRGGGGVGQRPSVAMPKSCQ
jgi:hypothetical protein